MRRLVCAGSVTAALATVVIASCGAPALEQSGGTSTSTAASPTAIASSSIGASAAPSTPSSSTATSEPSPPKAARGHYTVGTSELWMDCAGSGSPTVILESGLGGDHTVWSAVMDGLTDDAQVCRYDRINTGRSTAVEEPRTVGDAVEDLRGLLDKAGIDPPVVLVAHSFAGFNARLFAGQNPGDVAGLVLVDATPDEAIPAFRNRFGQAYVAGNNEERIDMETSLEEVQSVDLPDIPVVVMYAERGGPPLAPSSEAIANMPQGRLVRIESGHDIHLEHPDAVIDEIEAVLEEAR